MSGPWHWFALAGLGVFHGINPAMGWLFAVALGLHRESRAVVLLSLLPIAAGHAFSVALVATLATAAGVTLDEQLIQIGAGMLLMGWAIYHSLARHRVRFGMRISYLGLTGWSFLMASSHGAGLMLIPFLLPWTSLVPEDSHFDLADSFSVALAAVLVHSLAMLATTGGIAIVVYDRIGVAFLRRGWINMDRLWMLALVATSLLLLAMAGLRQPDELH